MAHQHPPRFLKIVDDAKSRVRETNVDEVKKRVDRGDKFVLVDVREESEYAKDHLPGAIHLGKGVIERDIEARVPALDTELVAGGRRRHGRPPKIPTPPCRSAPAKTSGSALRPCSAIRSCGRSS